MDGLKHWKHEDLRTHLLQGAHSHESGGFHHNMKYCQGQHPLTSSLRNTNPNFQRTVVMTAKLNFKEWHFSKDNQEIFFFCMRH